MGKDTLARFGGGHLPAGPIQQRLPELPLQLPDQGTRPGGTDDGDEEGED